MPKKEQDTRFGKFGTVSFTATTKINHFIDYLQEGMLMGTRCVNCGAVFFPPRADCCNCRAHHTEWFQVTGPGKLVSYTTLAFAPVGFDAELPYTLALADFGAHKVFGRLSRDICESEVTIGMAVRPRVITTSTGQYLYEFVAA